MSDAALQRTVRRVGAVVVLAVGTLAVSFLNYAEYGGYPVDVWDDVALLLVAGALAYLAGSLFVEVAAAVHDEASREPASTDEQAHGPE